MMSSFSCRPRPSRALALWIAGTLLVAAAPAAADDVLEGSPAVRRALLLRAERHEVAGLVGMSLGDPYLRNVLPGARYDYHMFDWLSLGGRLQVGIPIETEMYQQVDAKVTKTNDTFVMEASSLRMLLLGHVSVAPLVGKFLWRNASTAHFDLHLDLLAGAALVGSSGEALTTGPSLALGAAGGFRFFISDVMALTADMQVLTATRAMSVNSDSKEVGRKIRFHNVLNIGVSFFMPPKLRRGK